MAFLNKLGTNLLHGIAGNLSELTPAELSAEYGDYLMSGESINTGFVLIRDVVIFTDKRILFFDKQDVTGKKVRVSSIYLDSIIDVSAETAGFGFDDSEINIRFISSPYYRASGGVDISEKKFEFPKKYNIQPLYAWLQEIAYNNHVSINQ